MLRVYVAPFARFAGTVLNTGIVLICCWALAQYVRYAIFNPPEFDGAMNLNAALSLVRGRGYGYVYDTFFPFPTQTDAPYTLPAGLLMWIGGVKPWTTQGTNLAYIMGLLFVCFLLVRRMLNSTTWALVSSTLLLLTPGMFEFGLNGYGEVPTLFSL
jgi:hypothetical protein